MSSNTKKLIFLVVAVILGYWAISAVLHVVAGLLGALLPLAIVAGIVYVAYQMFGRKALGGGRRTLP